MLKSCDLSDNPVIWKKKISFFFFFGEKNLDWIQAGSKSQSVSVNKRKFTWGKGKRLKENKTHTNSAYVKQGHPLMTHSAIKVESIIQ